MAHGRKSIIVSVGKQSTLVGAVLALFVASVPAGAQVFESVELFFTPSEPTVQVGDMVELGLVVRSLNAFEAPMTGLNAVLSWEPGFLAFAGKIDNGPYNWQGSSFPEDSALDCLNCVMCDGDVFYEAISQFLPAPPGIAPPSDTEGLLVTTFVFEALAPTTGTILSTPLTLGQYSRTQVVSGTVPALDILDRVTPATITIVPEPAALVLLLSAAMLGYRRRS